MKEKILRAFEAYKNGVRPSSCGEPKYVFVLNEENDGELYPVKIIWALANQYDSTGSFNTKTAARELAKFGFRSINTETHLVYLSSKDNFYQQVEKSLKGNGDDRKRRLAASPKKPSKRIVEILQFNRNPDVVAEVLDRANGYCEKCHKKAPFIKKADSKPYLEVHHKIPLSENGDDTVENCIALCPNCHREEHYG